MPAASPFYLAYVADDTVAFNPVTHAVMDEYVFSMRRVLSETDKPLMQVEMRNPHIGVLNTSRQQWAWFSWLNPANNHVEPLMLGRIVGNASNAFAEIITVEFVSWPTNFFAQRQQVAETLKIAPFWDEVFVAVEKSDDPNTVLEAYSKLWCVDPITLKVTAEDILDASNGNINITNHFYDSLDMHNGEAPLTSVLIDATVSWTQTARGFIDMTPQQIFTFGGDGIIAEWPKPLTQLGSGWSVKSATAYDLNTVAAAQVQTYSYNWRNGEKEHADGDGLTVSISMSIPSFSGKSIPKTGSGSAGVGPISMTMSVQQQDGFLDPFAVDSDGDPSPLNIPASASMNYTVTGLWSVVTTLRVRYDMARQRTERVRIMLNANLQAVVNDPLVTQNSETITLTGRDVGVPIVDLLNWTTVANTTVTVGEVIFPDDPLLPGGQSAQICVVGGLTGTVEPVFSDVPGDSTVDGAAHWASMGTKNPTEGAQDWTPLTNFGVGAMILPKYPLWTTWLDETAPALSQYPPAGTPIALGQVVQGSNGYYFTCTLDGTTVTPAATGFLTFGTNIGPLIEPAWPSTYGATIVDGSVTWTCIGNALPDGATYYITSTGGLSGAQYVTPPFGGSTALHATLTDGTVTWTSIGPGVIPAGGTSGNVWARWYFPSARGKQSVQYLIALGRAHIRKRARAVEIEFEVPFEEGVGITCQNTVTLNDSRIPGGVALGKVTRAELSANGDTGEVKCHVTIACAVGFGDAVTVVPGTPVYAASGYMQNGYQQEVDGIEVLPDLEDVGYTPLVPSTNDDGLVLPLDYNQVVLLEQIKGTLAEQTSAVAGAMASMASVARSQIISGSTTTGAQQLQQLAGANSVALQLSLHPIYYELQLKPVTNGPFWDSYVVKTQKMTLPQGINLYGASTP